MDLLTLLLLPYLGGVLYGVLDQIALVRYGEHQGLPVSPAEQRLALVDALAWPVMLPYRVLFDDLTEDE